MEAAAHLKDMLDGEIQRFDRESARHKHLYRRSQTAVLVLTGLASVASGIGLLVPDRAPAFQFVVLVVASAATGITAWAEMRRARELWQHEREVHYALVDLRREMAFRESLRPLSKEDCEALFGRVQQVLGSSTHTWASIQQRKQGV